MKAVWASSFKWGSLYSKENFEGIKQAAGAREWIGLREFGEVSSNVETSMSAEIQCATTSHFNPTFEGPVKIGVSMSEGRGASEKNGIGRSGRKLNKSLRGRRSIFKMTESSLFPLSDSMNSMIELNTFQLKLESSKGDPNETEK
ncbi:hypothetical protein Goarm_005382 [Gossypium armourianum]|uniref:Uncharacterized protein n=1 Tax=Gossypium armourianum TaxID=34283 RepID=A0A7J9JZR6_9ROSI|nr:hypothetical protein [Gossypium armourianum]